MPAAKRRTLRGLPALALAVATAVPAAASLPRPELLDVDPEALLATVGAAPATVAAGSGSIPFALLEEAPGDRFRLLDPAAVEHVAFTGRAPRPHLFAELETRVRAIDFPAWGQPQGIQGFGWETAPGVLLWRKTYVPGPAGLDDAPQVVVEVFQPGSPFSGQARTYTYVTDEMGTVVGLVAEDEGTDPNAPPVPARYLYTPYGQAHAETGPELLRVRFWAAAIQVLTGGGLVTQSVADETSATPGSLVLTWSLSLDPVSLLDGLHVERLVPGGDWEPVPAEDLVVGAPPATDPSADPATELRVMLFGGWQEATSYRVRLTSALEDRLGRSFGRSETLRWSIPPAPSEDAPVPPPTYDRQFPRRYESYNAAAATAGGHFPGGQNRLFQGLWTDPVTGLAYARARWYDPRNAAWLSEDPLLDIDSPNLYAFVAWQPTMGTDPMGLCEGEPGDPEECVAWWPYFPPSVMVQTQERLEGAARNPELNRVSRALYGAQAWFMGVGASAEEEARHLLNLPHHLYDRYRQEKARLQRTEELKAELGCNFCVGDDLGVIHETLVAEGLMDDEVLGPGVANLPIGPGRLKPGVPRRRSLSAAEANAPHAAAGRRPPYAAGTRARDIVLERPRDFVRVHGEGNQARSWLMRREQIEGLTAAQIRDRFSLPELPSYMSDVHVPAGTRLRVGTVGEQLRWGGGGATQYELLDRLPESAFTNRRPLQ